MSGAGQMLEEMTGRLFGEQCTEGLRAELVEKTRTRSSGTSSSSARTAAMPRSSACCPGHAW